VTHTAKRADGTNGPKSTQDLILLERKRPESVAQQRIETVQAVGKDEVGGSNPPSSSKDFLLKSNDFGRFSFISATF
jgi:hypothetical protein